MKRLCCLILLIAVLGLIASGCQKSQNPVSATSLEENAPSSLNKATTLRKINLKDPMTEIWDVPCAAGGAGEQVATSGTMHIMVHYLIDSDDKWHVTIHENPQNCQGVGLTTGDTYQISGLAQNTWNFVISDTLPFVVTNQNIYRVIGKGPDNNFRSHYTYKLRWNANGDVVIDGSKWDVDCK
ncbi:hypothetical protein JXJ21_02805 [candidate division KSB1 bacterium]|nr:hypothetical protein [candidate division KSB1 bacterium]